MRLDLGTLGTFNELAERGSTSAASALAALCDVETAVDGTQIELVPISDVPGKFDAGDQFVGVEIAFAGDMVGTIVLVFDRTSAARLLQRIVPDHWGDSDAELDRSSISEAANIMVGGFVDAWADHFGVRIQPGPPTYVAGSGDDVVPEEIPAWDSHRTALTFSSTLRTPEHTGPNGSAAGGDAGSTSGTTAGGATPVIDFHIYMFPERSSFAAVVGDAMPDGEVPISMEKLSAFTEMTRTGAGRAGDKLAGMTGIGVEVELGRTTFVPVEDVDSHAPGGHVIGSVANLTGPPGGSIAILFDTQSAITVGDALLPVEGDGSGLTAQHRSAIEEIGNIMTSGFIDGWANALGRTVRHEPPKLHEDAAASILRSLVEQADAPSDHAFILEATVRAAGESIGCDLYAIPEERSFRELLDEMTMPQARAATTDPDALEPAAYEDLQ